MSTIPVVSMLNPYTVNVREETPGSWFIGVLSKLSDYCNNIFFVKFGNPFKYSIWCGFTPIGSGLSVELAGVFLIFVMALSIPFMNRLPVMEATAYIDAKTNANQYPIILVHGFISWGRNELGRSVDRPHIN